MLHLERMAYIWTMYDHVTEGSQGAPCGPGNSMCESVNENDRGTIMHFERTRRDSIVPPIDPLADSIVHTFLDPPLDRTVGHACPTCRAVTRIGCMT